MSRASYMYIDNGSNISELESMFPLPCSSYMTRGMAEGIILRFKTFYLKIYPASNDTSMYVVYGFSLLSPNKEMFKHEVPISKMTRYASQFISEDYLCGQYTIP